MLSRLGHQVQNHVCKRQETVSWDPVGIAMLAVSCQQGFNNNEDNRCCLSNVFDLYALKCVSKNILLSHSCKFSIWIIRELNDLFKVMCRRGFANGHES